jgi:hypothetical protein
MVAARKAFDAIAADGTIPVPVIHDPRAYDQLNKLQAIVQEMGPEIRADQMIALRRTWDRVVKAAGGFEHRAGGSPFGVPLADQSEAAAKRVATSAMRRVLAKEVPELADVNREYSFWKSLNDVLTATNARAKPQGRGLAQTIAQGAGATIGGVTGGGNPVTTLGTAVIGGKIAQQMTRVFQSPQWKLASAQAKNKLAAALVSGNPSAINRALQAFAVEEAGTRGRLLTGAVSVGR